MQVSLGCLHGTAWLTRTPKLIARRLPGSWQIARAHQRPLGPRTCRCAPVVSSSHNRSPLQRSSHRLAAQNGSTDSPTPDAAGSSQRPPPGSAASGSMFGILLKAIGSAVMLAMVSAVAPRPTYASNRHPNITTVCPTPTTGSSSSSSSSDKQDRWHLAGLGDLSAAAAAGGGSSTAQADQVYVGPYAGRSTQVLPGRSSSSSSRAALPSREEMEKLVRSDKGLQELLSRRKAQWYASRPQLAGSGAYESRLAALGIPLDFDELMTSMVYAPDDVPDRLERGDIYTTLNAVLNQYDAEDFDLGIKQFMIEQAIQQEMEEGLDKKGDNKDFEEKLAEQLFADDQQEKVQIRTADIEDDAFTTEKAEEAALLMGPGTSLKSAWRVGEHLRELAYTQLWQLVSEGHVDTIRVYGPEERAALVNLKPSAPGGARVAKVVLAPDPDLIPHLLEHGVGIDSGNYEGERLNRAFLIQVARYTFPFVFISALFWLLHTWILDPVPNQFRRREFIRYRREILHVSTKLNFRSPARQVFIDTTSPDFIPWDDINGIDEVKQEIEEIIDYLKDPALLRLRGVARIGGVLLAGAPGTGKTLLAKAIAAESGVRMFTCSGTDFYDVYTGVGARRIRETFDTIRNFAPAILFVDEFDALGAARSGSSTGDESASIINELLVQMDGFEDNRGIVVLGATNRPGAIDAALIRPGRFDRIIYMPLPDAAGRAKILQVHARNKSVDPSINWVEVSRAMSGFTGADCMGIMARAARMAARQGREALTEEDIYAAMENKAMESFQEMSGAPSPGTADVPDPIPLSLRKSIAVYEAGKALLAYITPDYDEIARVSICPYNMITGYVLFVEDEGARANALLTRGDMEAVMVVHMAGRCAEKLVMGEGEMTGLGSADLFHANMVAREMVLSAGFSRKLGPVDFMRIVSSQAEAGDLLRSLEPKDADEQDYYYHASDMPTEQARVALAEVIELLEAAEAKAYYGLAINWQPLQALTQALLDRGILQGREVAHILETNGVVHFPDPHVEGFGWDQAGALNYPFRPTPPDSSSSSDQQQQEGQGEPVLAGVAAKTRGAGTDGDAPRDADGKYALGWHWNSPYTVKRDWPEWYRKELERYKY